MRNLQLSLIKKWFEKTKSQEKREDYREITPYWCNRLLLHKGKNKSNKWWSLMVNTDGLFTHTALIEDVKRKDISFKQFENNIMTLGYPKKTDLERILTFKHEGIEIREGREDWGAVPGVKYFVIKHGEKIICKKYQEIV